MTLYVDDILIAYNDLEMIAAIKCWLTSKFSMKEMGDVNYVIGVKIHRNRSKRGFWYLTRELSEERLRKIQDAQLETHIYFS